MSDLDARLNQMADIRTLLITSVVSAMALVVGLFWNDAIKSTIEQIVPTGESLFYKYLAAIIVTLIVVVVVYALIRGQKIAIEQLKTAEKNKRRRKRDYMRL